MYTYGVAIVEQIFYLPSHVTTFETIQHRSHRTRNENRTLRSMNS